METAVFSQLNASNWMNDFGISVSKKTPSTIGLILCVLWLTGVCIMAARLFNSMLRFQILKKSALPLQSPALRRLYRCCLGEMHITKYIPVYSTVFLNPPVIAGLFKPRVYLPIHLISDYNAKDIRYMLLHELQHYKYGDALVNYIMNVAGILYWFNPFVWLALKEMRCDREIACDTSVLKMLEEDASETLATGPAAAELTFSILSDLNLWNTY